MDPKQLALRELAFHAHAAGEWQSLFAAIDRRQLLAQQASCFDGFAAPAADLEQHALAGAVEVGDWERFVRYALVAVNLRGLAEGLADEGTLRALTLQGRRRLAENLASQLPDPGPRAAAKSVIAAASGEGAEAAALRRQVSDDLRSLPEPSDEAAAGAMLAALTVVARHLGAELAAEWPAVARRLERWPALASRLWLTVADSCHAREGGRPASDALRRVLRQVGDPTGLAGTLRGWFRDGGSVAAVRDLLSCLPAADGALFWDLAFVALERRARADPGGAWQELCLERATGPAIPWSVARIEAGCALFAQLTAGEARALAAELPHAEHRAALQVVRLEARADSARARAALAAVRQLPAASDRLHWLLRLAAAWPAAKAASRRRLAAAARARLCDRRYAAAAADLCRYLDLVAEVFGTELRREVDNVVRAPGSGGATLLALGAGVRALPVLEILCAGAELFAATAETSAAAFGLRSRLIVGVASRLCVMRRSLEPLRAAAARLLPEEEEDLCAAAASALAREQPELAREACGMIRDRRRQLAAELALAAGEPASRGDDLELPRLYHAAASVAAAEDECAALALLAGPPLDLRERIDDSMLRLGSKERRVQALLDLARQALRLDERLHAADRRDPLGPLQLLRQSLTGIGSDERLLALTVELAEVIAPLPPARLLPELHEAFEVALLRFPAVPWPHRRETFEGLLVRASAALNRGAGELIDAILELPERAAEGPAGEEIRRHWHEILVLATVAAERLQAPIGSRLARGERTWRWLTGEQRRIARCCREGVAERRRRADGWLALRRMPPAGEAAALAYLLAGPLPEIACDLATRLPAGAGRDDLCLRLLRHGWVTQPAAGRLEAAIGDPAAAAAARLCRPDLAPATWVADLAELVARHGLEPSHPRAWPLLRRLRQLDEHHGTRLLAEAVAQALALGGRQAGERMVVLWLNAFLAPRPGRNEEAWHERSAKMRAAIAGALSLGVAPPADLLTDTPPAPPSRADAPA
ncbi:MAG TPA: hypothetical protein VKY89_12570 [Thermoanaerobaculia bacterium]|nr:hypothetical protein [Thermoanaerobaculia bacterium]